MLGDKCVKKKMGCAWVWSQRSPCGYTAYVIQPFRASVSFSVISRVGFLPPSQDFEKCEKRESTTTAPILKASFEGLQPIKERKETMGKKNGKSNIGY